MRETCVRWTNAHVSDDIKECFNVNEYEKLKRFSEERMEVHGWQPLNWRRYLKKKNSSNNNKKNKKNNTKNNTKNNRKNKNKKWIPRSSLEHRHGTAGFRDSLEVADCHQCASESHRPRCRRHRPGSWTTTGMTVPTMTLLESVAADYPESMKE